MPAARREDRESLQADPSRFTLPRLVEMELTEDVSNNEPSNFAETLQDSDLIYIPNFSFSRLVFLSFG